MLAPVIDALLRALQSERHHALGEQASRYE